MTEKKNNIQIFIYSAIVLVIIVFAVLFIWLVFNHEESKELIDRVLKVVFMAGFFMAGWFFMKIGKRKQNPESVEKQGKEVQ